MNTAVANALIQCMPALASAVRAGRADPRHFALLADRLRRSRGLSQIYGTDRLMQDGRVPFPGGLAEPSTVDARRAIIGLPPISTTPGTFRADD